ncbi:Hypp3974 [Branchiostoma lanceolatum]|uniref:Hypp3974 protein n=1 Tax=Branchiostoma lanceolatum TaxID=7740 RepID=A0A8K0A7A3_BRALA|nr:Hypp3974 [Branchiostoma lanceolatum]
MVTGMDRDTYYALSAGEIEMDFFCSNCLANLANDPHSPVPNQPSLDGSFQAEGPNEAPPSPGPVNGSFHFQADGSFEVPDPNRNLEDTIADVSVEDNLPVDEGGEVTFELIEFGTKRGHHKLADSNGFSYTRKEKTPRPSGAIYWTCKRRPTGPGKCPATVIEKPAGMYRRGNNRHNHPPEMQAATNLRIQAKVRQRAVENLFRSAGQIVEEVVMEEVDVRAPNPDLPSITNMVRMANKRRQELRPKDPTTLDFELEEQHIPEGFFRKDIRFEDHRHIILASDHQLKMLGGMKTWYMDATFKVVAKPFYQLFGIHGFVREDDAEKQVPLVVVFMSHKGKEDYKKVLKKILRLLPGDPKVKTFVMDFEAGMWQAVRSLFPGKTRRGCAFHWAQAVLNKIKEFGLIQVYRQREGAHRLMRYLMSLHMLPYEHVRSTFEALCREADNANDARLDRLTAYMRDTWMESIFWEVSEWVVFMEPVRTNNDTEGWHRRLKQKANRVHLPFYLLVHLLKKEADFVSLQVQQVTYKRLKKYQRARYRSIQGKLFSYWKDYAEGRRTTSSLLRACSRVYAPVVDGE